MSGDAGAGVLALPDLAVLQITGGAARDFLSRQLTCDLSRLGPGHSVLGAWLTPKGRAVTLMRLAEAGDGELRALVPSDLADDVVRRMGMFVLREDVAIARAADDRVLGLAGAVVEEAARHEAMVPGLSLFALDRTAPLAMIAGAAPRVDELLDALRASGAGELGPEQWRALQVRAGLPWIVAGTREAFVPQMVNLDRIGAVSFSKGCYPGQEIVARTQHLGRIKRRMFIARCATDEPAAQPGDTLTSDAGDTSGRVVVAAHGAHAQEMLVVLPLDAVAAGARFRLGGAAGPPVAVSPPPYSLDDPGC